jgi:hypothetical protein
LAPPAQGEHVVRPFLAKLPHAHRPAPDELLLDTDDDAAEAEASLPAEEPGQLINP